MGAKDFTLCTDHRPIVTKFYSTTQVASPRQERFFDFISQMTNKLKHVSGKENVADVLSRPADPPLLNLILPNSAGINYLKMAEEQQSDLDLQNLKQNNTTSLLLKYVPLGETGATLLCDDSQGRLRPLVPKSMRRAVFQHFHSSSHPGIKSGTKSIGRLMVWRDMRKDIRQWTKECQACARSKVIRRNTANVEAVTPPPRGRFTHVYLDIIGPLGLSKGHNYVLTVIDRFSRFFQAIPQLALPLKCASTDLFLVKNLVKTNSMNNGMFVQLFGTENLNTVASPRGEMVIKRPQLGKA